MQLLNSYDLFVDHQWQAEANGNLKAFRSVQFRRQLHTVPPRSPQQAEGENSQRYLLEKYKLYVEIADRMSSRRIWVNALFVGFNLVAITLLSFLSQDVTSAFRVWEFLPLLAMSATCMVWWKLTHLYRRLNFGRSKAIQKLEQCLSVTPYETEWSAKGNSKPATPYKSLTGLEYWVPLCFICLYFLAATRLCLSGQ